MSSTNQKIVSGIFMIYILAVNIALTYYSFNVQSSLSNLSDKTNISILSYINAFNSWDISLIAVGITILIISIIGVIVSPYIIVGFLFLYLLVIVSFFVYTSIALNALLGTSDYNIYKIDCTTPEGKNIANCDSIQSNFQNGLRSTITIMVLCGFLILSIILFLYFMIRSLSKSGGLEREIETLFSKTKIDERFPQRYEGPFRFKRPEDYNTPELSKLINEYAARELGTGYPYSPQSPYFTPKYTRTPSGPYTIPYSQTPTTPIPYSQTPSTPFPYSQTPSTQYTIRQAPLSPNPETPSKQTQTPISSLFKYQ